MTIIVIVTLYMFIRVYRVNPRRYSAWYAHSFTMRTIILLPVTSGARGAG